MGRNVPVDGLADAIMEGLEEYADLATDTMKKAVRHSSKTVKDEIEAHAPKDTGTYSKSWRASKQTETSTKLEMTVHSANRYQIAHLLEHGHAKRGVVGLPQGHISPLPKKKASVTWKIGLRRDCLDEP